MNEMKLFQSKEAEPSSAPLKRGRRLRNDMILIAVILLTIAVVALALFLLKKEGDTVTVTVDGVVVGEYSLHENRTVEIKSGDGYNILVIENGEVSIRHASCPDKICAAHRPIKRDGESIICLPNKVVVEVHTQDQKQPDIIT